MSKLTGYVVYFDEHLRDETIDHAKCFGSLEGAVEFINQSLINGWAGHNYTYRLFEMGKEIPLDKETVEEPQPSKTKIKVKVKGKK